MKKKKRNRNYQSNQHHQNNTENNQSPKYECSQPNSNTENDNTQSNYNNQNNSNNQNNNNSQDNNKSNTPKSKLCCFSSTDYIVLSSTLAIALGEELSQTDLNILSTFFAALSDNLAIIAATQSCNTGEENVFTPPVPDVAVTSPSPLNKKRSKKIVKRKVRKK